MVIRRFESSRPSQVVPKPEIVTLKGQKSPLLAGFCNSGRSLNSQIGELAGRFGQGLRLLASANTLAYYLDFTRNVWF
jgi:hypothetical protein